MQWYDGKLFLDSEAPNQLTDDAQHNHPSGPFDSLGLRFGASVFTTLRLYNQDIKDARSQYVAHCDRLSHSLRCFGWHLPNWSAVAQGCATLQHQYAILRITIFANGTEWITGRALPTDLARQQETGLCCWLAPALYARSLPMHKTGNYLACHLARRQAQRKGAQEAILTNAQGEWLETATGNLWGWAQGQWWSPGGNHSGGQCLPGLMKARIVNVLAQDGQTVNEQPWDRKICAQFEAIAYSNCVVEFMPVHTILDGQTKLKYNLKHPRLIALKHKLLSKN